MGQVTAYPRAGRLKLTSPAPLNAGHDVAGFDCGKLSLNDWVKNQARKSEGKFARTYVVCSGTAVVGYYCLSAGTVERGGAPDRIRRNAPDPIPVSILGRLAVDKSMARQGLGADLLSDAFRRIAGASEVIGISALLVHVLDDEALAFYGSQAEYLEFPEGSRTLFLPIATLVDAF